MALRLGYLASLLLLFSIEANAMTGGIGQRTNVEFLRFCEFDAVDFEAVRTEFEKRFPIGSDSGELIETIHQSAGYETIWNKKPWPPPELDLEIIYYISVYSYPCRLDHGNENIWYFIVATNLDGNIARSEFRLFFKDEKFEVRGIPFRFDNFLTEADGKKALWGLTGAGTSRDAIERLMRDAGVKKLETRVEEDKIIDQYRKYPDKKSLGYQLGGHNIWVLIWEFDEGGRLRNLRIN